MSITELTATLEEEWEVLFLLPAIINGYLYHKIGSSGFLVLAVVSLPVSAFILSVSYAIDVNSLTELPLKSYFGFNVAEFIYLVSYFPWLLSYILGVYFLFTLLDWADYIMVYMFLGTILLTLIGLIVISYVAIKD